MVHSPLPAGWEEKVDSGRSYYVDRNSQRTTWTRPVENGTTNITGVPDQQCLDEKPTKDISRSDDLSICADTLQRLGLFNTLKVKQPSKKIFSQKKSQKNPKKNWKYIQL